jgi:DNA polymerase elongation subunit (family B)
MLTELLLLDIETIPQEQRFSSLSPVWQKLFSNKSTKTMPETMNMEENYHAKAGIWAEFGKIICISTAFFYEDNNKQLCLRIKTVSDDDEKELLKNFILLCNKFYSLHKQFQFGGHNIREFDIPYICRRLVINNIPLPSYLQLHDKKPWEVKMFDTLSWWKFGDIKNYISLNLLAHTLDIPSSKTTMDGSMVQDVYYIEKNLPKIIHYCEQDVIVTANIILRFLNKPVLNEQQINRVN